MGFDLNISKNTHYAYIKSTVYMPNKKECNTFALPL